MTMRCEKAGCSAADEDVGIQEVFGWVAYVCRAHLVAWSRVPERFEVLDELERIDRIDTRAFELLVHGTMPVSKESEGRHERLMVRIFELRGALRSLFEAWLKKPADSKGETFARVGVLSGLAGLAARESARPEPEPAAPPRMASAVLSSVSSDRTRILRWLAEVPIDDRTEERAAWGLSMRQSYAAALLRDLSDNGFIRSDERGRWSLVASSEPARPVPSVPPVPSPPKSGTSLQPGPYSGDGPRGSEF